MKENAPTSEIIVAHLTPASQRWFRAVWHEHTSKPAVRAHAYQNKIRCTLF